MNNRTRWMLHLRPQKAWMVSSGILLASLVLFSAARTTLTVDAF
jgi:hypothetical protein